MVLPATRAWVHHSREQTTQLEVFTKNRFAKVRTFLALPVGKRKARLGAKIKEVSASVDLLVRFVSLPLEDGRLPTYPVSAQLSISDFSIAPATASGDDEPDDMPASYRKWVRKAKQDKV